MVVWTGITVPVNRKNVMRSKAIFKRGYREVVPMIGTLPAYQSFICSMAKTFSHLPKFGKTLVTLSMRSLLHSRKDIDGIIKPVFDALERSGVIDNDKQIKMIVYESFPVKQSEQEMISVDLFPYSLRPHTDQA